MPQFVYGGGEIGLRVARSRRHARVAVHQHDGTGDGEKRSALSVRRIHGDGRRGLRQHAGRHLDELHFDAGRIAGLLLRLEPAECYPQARIAHGVPHGRGLLHLAEHRGETVVARGLRAGVADMDGHGIVEQRAKIEFFVNRGVKIGAQEMHVVVIRCRGRRQQQRHGQSSGLARGLPGHFATLPLPAASEAAIRLLSWLSGMTSVWSFTGRPVRAASITSRLAARVAAGSGEPPGAIAKSPCVKPITWVGPDSPVQRKKTYSSPRWNTGAPSKVCRSLLATPPGTATSTELCPAPLNRSETWTV